MNQAVILQGDAIEQLRTLPDESVQCVVALANRRLDSTTLGLPLEIAA